MKVIVAFVDKGVREMFSNVNQFAQNLMGEWNCPDIEYRPLFEDLGGGYGLMFYKKGNEEFVEKLLKSKGKGVLMVEANSEEMAKEFYKNVFSIKIPYFKKERDLEDFLKVKENMERDGYSILSYTGKIYI